jgi:hypothetical protein
MKIRQEIKIKWLFKYALKEYKSAEVAEATGVSERKIKRILKEHDEYKEQSTTFGMPGNKQNGSK